MMFPPKSADIPPLSYEHPQGVRDAVDAVCSGRFKEVDLEAFTTALKSADPFEHYDNEPLFFSILGKLPLYPSRKADDGDYSGRMPAEESNIRLKMAQAVFEKMREIVEENMKSDPGARKEFYKTLARWKDTAGQMSIRGAWGGLSKIISDNTVFKMKESAAPAPQGAEPSP